MAYLLDGRLKEAVKSITAATEMDPDDQVNVYLQRVIGEVVDGTRPQPASLADLTAGPARRKRRFWEFWKK